MIDAFWRDVRFALRGLGRTPAFTAIAVLTLALGIGANTAIFSVVNTVLLRPLAYGEPERLVALTSSYSARGESNVQVSAPELNDYRRGVGAFEDAAGAWPININLTGSGEPERIAAAVVSPNFFRVLGVAPAAGRDFTNEDAGGRIGYVALISYELWQRRFGGDPGSDRQDGPPGRRSDHHHRRHAARLPAPDGKRRRAVGALGPDRSDQSRPHIREQPAVPRPRRRRPPQARPDDR